MPYDFRIGGWPKYISYRLIIKYFSLRFAKNRIKLLAFLKTFRFLLKRSVHSTNSYDSLIFLLVTKSKITWDKAFSLTELG